MNKVPVTYRRNKFVKNAVTLVTPRSIWTAGCCVWIDPKTKAEKTESFVVMSNNQKEKQKLHQTEMSVVDLERLLKAPSSKTAVNLFPENAKCRNAVNNISPK